MEYSTANGTLTQEKADKFRRFRKRCNNEAIHKKVYDEDIRELFIWNGLFYIAIYDKIYKLLAVVQTNNLEDVRGYF